MRREKEENPGNIEKFLIKTENKNKQKGGKLIQGMLENPGKIEKFLIKTENKTKQQNQTIPNNENLTTKTGNNKIQQEQQSLKEKIMKFSSTSPPKLPTNPMHNKNNNDETKTTTTRETTTLMEIIKRKQMKRQQQQQQSENKKTMKTTKKQKPTMTKTKTLQLDPSTEPGSPKKNDIRLYLAKKLEKTEAVAAALPPTNSLVLSPSTPPPTTQDPTAPQLSANPSIIGDSARCMMDNQRGTCKTEREPNQMTTLPGAIQGEKNK